MLVLGGVASFLVPRDPLSFATFLFFLFFFVFWEDDEELDESDDVHKPLAWRARLAKATSTSTAEPEKT